MKTSMMKVRKMSRLLAKYDPYDVEDDWDAEAQAENFSEDLSCIIGSIFSNYDKVYIKGAVGRWDGPHWGRLSSMIRRNSGVLSAMRTSSNCLSSMRKRMKMFPNFKDTAINGH